MTSATALIARASESAAPKLLPAVAAIIMSGSILDMCSSESRLKPLNTDSTTTIAVVATATPAMAIDDIMLTARCDFLEKR